MSDYIQDWRERLATTQMYGQEHTHLHLCALDAEQHAHTCNYWYVLTTYGGTGHTAFRTRAAAVFWLEARGLPVPADLPEPGTYAPFRVAGIYRSALWLDVAGWAELRSQVGYVGDILSLSNARYTVGIVTRDPEGVRTVHTLNPNVPRLDLDYWRAQKAEDLGGWITSRSCHGVTHERAGMVPARQEGGL